MRILALEPYYGGSHKAFLEGWSVRSRHEWSVLGLPARKWKWRMRHAAVTFAEQVAPRVEAGERWELLFCSDLLDLAGFRGLAAAEVGRLPAVAYFHENQLTYPVRHENERDYHYGFTNMTTGLAARQVWFNSAFNRDSFLGALTDVLKKMPDYQPLNAVARIRDKSHIWPQGVAEFPARGPRKPGPLRLLWAARWEHDKDPDSFFAAVELLKQQGSDFRLSVIGERFRDVPEVFERARREFEGHIDRWGYQESRTEYEGALLEADVVVSTAAHEFFGVSIVEAVAAGAYPLLPRRLAYPEIFGVDDAVGGDSFFYEGGAKELAGRLAQLAKRVERDDLWQGEAQRGRRAVQRFSWPRLAPLLDGALEHAAHFSDM